MKWHKYSFHAMLLAAMELKHEEGRFEGGKRRETTRDLETSST